MTQLPKTLRAHILARYWWCAEQSRLLALFPELRRRTEKQCMMDGTKVHNWLELRPKSKSESVLLRKLREVSVIKGTLIFKRVLDGITIVGTPDDFQIVFIKRKRYVKIVEYKTVNHHKLDPYVTCQAVFQVQIYCWIMEPILEKLRYQLAPVHEVVLYNRKNATYIGKVCVYYRLADVEKELKYIFDMYRGRTPQIAPSKWKCKVCEKELKERCTLRKT